jgi:hypothetical protein
MLTQSVEDLRIEIPGEEIHAREKVGMLVSIYSLVFVVTFTLLSAFCDAVSFTHAARVWQGNRIVWREVLYSTGAIIIGSAFYYLAVRYISQAGIVSAEIQTLLWFTAVAIGVATLNGQAFNWQPVDQVVALGVLLGIGWLLIRAHG